MRNTYRALRPFYPRQNHPSEQLIQLTMERFRTTFTLIDNSHPQRRRTVHTEEAIATVERSIAEDPNESIRHRAQELDLCPSTVWKILRKDLGMRAYKIQLVQEWTVPSIEKNRGAFWSLYSPKINKLSKHIIMSAIKKVGSYETSLENDSNTIDIDPCFFKNISIATQPVF